MPTLPPHNDYHSGRESGNRKCDTASGERKGLSQLRVETSIPEPEVSVRNPTALLTAQSAIDT